MRGKPGSGGITGQLFSVDGKTVLTQPVSIRDLNMTEFMVIRKSLKIFTKSFVGAPVIERDTFNAVGWVNNCRD